MKRKILLGVTLGEHIIVGAGFVFTKSFPNKNGAIVRKPANFI